jgi:hypothetical protein
MFGSPGNTGQPEGDQYVGELQTLLKGPTVWLGRLGGGGLVYQLGTATVKGKTGKLSPSWKGPGVVIEKLTPYL